jgi:hypothetical protein
VKMILANCLQNTTVAATNVMYITVRKFSLQQFGTRKRIF